MRHGLSLEPRSSNARAPLHHSATLDCPPHFRFVAGPPAPPPHQRSRPPLRKSIRIDDQSEHPFEQPDSESPSCLSSFESQHDCEPTNNATANNRDKSSLSAINDTNDFSDRVLYDKHSSFRTMRMRGTSSDRILAKKRHDQKSVSSLGDHRLDSAASSTTTVSLLEKHLGKFYKLGKFEKSKRFSTNALYDDSPNEAFYNKTGSARLSSQELFEKFCSEDFVSLYGHENDNGDYAYYDKHGFSKSLESSQIGIQNKNSIEEQSPKCESKPISLSQANLGAIKKTKGLYAKRLESAPKKIEYSPDAVFRSPGPFERRTHFSSETPFSLPPNITDIIDYEHDGSMESLNEKDHSRSAPLLSPKNDVFQFIFDIPEVSKAEDVSNMEESPSDATETRNLTLYEEPHSDRTSLSDIYEPCFTSGIRSKRSSIRRTSSIKRDFTYKSQPVFDLTNLDFRPIDDESPNTSKFVSLSSPDDVGQSNLDTKSYYSDSVFVSPEKVSSKESSKRTDTTTAKQKSPQEITNPSTTQEEKSDSSTLEEEPLSIMDKVPETYEYRTEFVDEIVKRKTNLSPLLETRSDDRYLDIMTLEQSKLMTSRPSMHKLEPFYPSNKSDEGQTIEQTATEQYDKVVDLGRLSMKQQEKSTMFKMKKVRDSSTVNVNRRTRCFPL